VSADGLARPTVRCRWPSQRPGPSDGRGRPPGQGGSRRDHLPGRRLTLDRFGVDGHPVIRGLFLAVPVLLAVLLVFLWRAWGQNFIALPLARDVANTEPAGLDDDLANGPVQPVASRVQLASQPTVSVTVPAATADPAAPPSRSARVVGPWPRIRPYAPWEDPDGDDLRDASRPPP
jgi:hypothetical protein